jgi:hypothetical protein
MLYARSASSLVRRTSGGDALPIRFCLAKLLRATTCGAGLVSYVLTSLSTGKTGSKVHQYDILLRHGTTCARLCTAWCTAVGVHHKRTPIATIKKAC